MQSWGTEGTAAAAMARVAPSMVGDREFLRWYAKVQRHFVPPDSAAELMRTALDTDIRPLLSAIHVPTLVLARGWTDHELDREMASQIEGARFELRALTNVASRPSPVLLRLPPRIRCS
jgi:hypothetical protein